MQTLRPRGLTLLEVIIVVVIIAILAALLFPTVSDPYPHRLKPEKRNLVLISMAMTKYTLDWNGFPAFDPAITTSDRRAAELLYSYLCVPHVYENRTLGPYIEGDEGLILRNGTDKPALVSPLGGFYTFGFQSTDGKITTMLLIDPGKDKLLGGTMDAIRGFVPTDPRGTVQEDNLVQKVGPP